MNSSLLSIPFQGQTIHGIVDLPEADTDQEKKAILFLNGMGGYRTGPHDMFVCFSRKFARLGYHGVRFDFRGKGFSGGVSFSASTASMLEDIEVLISYIREELKIERISILGICIGAKLGLYYTKNSGHPIQNLILLSSVPLRVHEKTLQVAYQQSGMYARDYLKKLFREATWKKFFSGRIHYRRIVGRILNPFRNHSGKPRPKSANSAVLLPVPACFPGLKKALIIHAEQDPDTLLALPQIEQLLDQHSIPYRSHIIEGANHSFYSTAWTERIWNIIRPSE